MLRRLLPGLLLLVQGCASTGILTGTTLGSEDAACVGFFEAMDDRVERAGVEDAGTARVEGFPHLRIDRFFASLATDAMSDAAFRQWIEHLRRLDASARRFEAANLPPGDRTALSTSFGAGTPLTRTIGRCGRHLNHRVTTTPALRALLLERARVPDAYQTWKRIVGGYGLARLAAKIALARLHEKLAAPFRIDPADLPVEGRRIRYGPPSGERLTATEVADALRAAYDNPLRIPLPREDRLNRLFDTFAPVWEIDVVNRSDRMGEVAVDRGGRPWINTAFPTVYRTYGLTRFHGDVLLQLVYQIWLPAREKTGPFDLYGGNLDSVLWRVTLSRSGEPIAYDSIHACGCYYLLFPGPGYRAIPAADGAEAVLAPLRAPLLPPKSRMLISLQTRTHYLQGVSVSDDGPADHAYAWRTYDDLRALSAPGARRYSLFGRDGIVAASRRSERFLLWPFGVPSPGAMRQWGTHAIAFTGRRHFDDPFLLEHLIAADAGVNSNGGSEPRSPPRPPHGPD